MLPVVHRVRIEHYRSLRDLSLKLGQVTVVQGANGSGKSNLYRALRLLPAAAQGRLAEAFAAEGGMPSVLYAGPKRRDEIREVRLTVGVDFDAFSYRLSCGLPLPRPTMFKLDPEVKEEDLGAVVSGRRRPVPLCQRRGHVVTVPDGEGVMTTLTDPLDLGESVLSQLADPRRWPELAMTRQFFGGWRFYHQFRTDPEAPARQPRLGVRSPVLSDDGANLAAVLQTIRELDADGGEALDTALDQAFPGCSLEITGDARGMLTVGWRQPGIHRALDARELSDGTLRFLCLAAALLTPRPPLLLVLNEPETSLHPALLPALAGLIADAGARCQVLVTTHAEALVEGINERCESTCIRLALHDGQTSADGERGLL
jgi:predicted ATPase